MGESRSSRNALAEISTEILYLATTIQETEQEAEFDALYNGVLKLFDEFEVNAKARGFDAVDIADAKYALAAFADETVLRSSWQGKDRWADNPLQLEFFETYVAGEGFFEKLERVRADAESRADVLEVYALCLLLGFKGKFGVGSGEELRTLKANLQKELARIRPSAPDSLSPHVLPTGDSAASGVQLPRWMMYVCAGTLAVSLLLYLGFFIRIWIGKGNF